MLLQKTQFVPLGRQINNMLLHPLIYLSLASDNIHLTFFTVTLSTLIYTRLQALHCLRTWCSSAQQRWLAAMSTYERASM